eukprot:jgi/Mesvir1/12931/Mv05949-RA.1
MVSCMVRQAPIAFAVFQPPRSLPVHRLGTSTWKRCPARTTLRTVAQIAGNTASVDCVVVGGGAAGMTAAYFAALGGAHVVVLERTREAGKKILMSGGTRCNVLPLTVDVQKDYFTDGPLPTLRGLFKTWSLPRCREWLESEVGLALAEETETNKVFPVSNSAREVRDKLAAAVTRVGGRFQYNASVERIAPAPQSPPSVPTAQGPRWEVTLADGSQVSARCVVMATGGLSFPAVGTDGTGHRILSRREIGNSLVPVYPALTPLKGPHPHGEQLAGISLNVALRLVDAGEGARGEGGEGKGGEGKNGGGKSAGKRSALVAPRTGMLFTHKGFSGPAVLDLSHHIVRVLEGSRRAAPTTITTTTATATTADATHYEGEAQTSGLAEQSSTAATQGNVPDASSKCNTGTSPPQRAGSPVAPQAVPRSVRLEVDWTGEGAAVWDERLRAGGRGQVANLLRTHGVPERLAVALVDEAGVPRDRALSELRKEERGALLAALTRYPLACTGHEGYKKAEVTGGGVRLQELDTRTMESRSAPVQGLYIVGELCDVFGRIGGFNFYWAWLSGRLAGIAVGKEAAAATAGNVAKET